MISLTISTWLTSTLHLNAVSEPKHPIALPQLHWNELWSSLFDANVAYGEPRVWQTHDRQGHLYWHAYDPTTRRSFWCESEEEMRQWLEERYYYQQSEEKIRCL